MIEKLESLSGELLDKGNTPEIIKIKEQIDNVKAAYDTVNEKLVKEDAKLNESLDAAKLFEESDKDLEKICEDENIISILDTKLLETDMNDCGEMKKKYEVRQ